MKDLNGNKIKHDHKFSNILKGCILAIVMLAPFFAILSKIIYVSANKNAKESYYGETINEQQIKRVEHINQLLTNQVYYFSQSTTTNPNQSREQNNNFTALIVNYRGETYENVRIGFYNDANQTPALFARPMNDITATLFSVSTASEYMTTLSFQYITVSQNFDTNLLNVLYISYIEYNKDSYLDNVFYYAIDQSKDEELLNWTKNTPIYNVINTMNTGLGLSANHILTYLLTYWCIILAIYIVFDIIIFVFTKITHYLQ